MKLLPLTNSSQANAHLPLCLTSCFLFKKVVTYTHWCMLSIYFCEWGEVHDSTDRERLTVDDLGSLLQSYPFGPSRAREYLYQVRVTGHMCFGWQWWTQSTMKETHGLYYDNGAEKSLFPSEAVTNLVFVVTCRWWQGWHSMSLCTVYNAW